jgi:3-oxoacyl-[acyl-carrier protein] reductase
MKSIHEKRVALVTGGARGIGLGIARCLTQEGYHLAIADLLEESAAVEAIEALRSSGRAVFYVQADIGSAAERRCMIDAVREHFGALHLLVNNAGVAPKVRRDMLETEEEAFDWLLRINLYGPYFLTQSVARWMLEQKNDDPGFEGRIVNITSISATVASVNRPEYCISKAGLAMASQLWAARLAEHGITVYDVRPGIIQTDMTAAVKEKYDRLIADGLTLQRRWGTPEDVGRVVAAVARGDFGYSTGQVLMVDGGMSVQRL